MASALHRDAETARAQGPPAPPLWPALGALTGLQAIVALGLFAPGILAPRLGLDPADLGLYATAVFATGAATATVGGWAAARFGSFAVATFCAAAVGLGMAAASLGTPAGLLAAGVLVGLAFGPETPASSALLGRLAAGPRAPLVFSVRQTGNQLGAVAGSILLPLIALGPWPRGGYGLVAVAALAGAVVFLRLRPAYDGLSAGPARALDVVGAVRLLRDDRALRRLAFASAPWSALQLALNAFFVSLAVDRLGLTHVAAGLVLAGAQFAGLLGRLGWGLAATRCGAGRVIAGLGVAMGLVALALAATSPGVPLPILAALALALGLTASGWNGVFLAEVARLAPAGRIAEATGAVLLGSYTGLVLGPAVMTGLAGLGSLALGYAVLGGLSGLAGLVLLRTPPVAS